MVFAAIIRLSSEEGAFGGSLRCNKFWSGHLARFGSFEFQPIVLFLWSRVASLPAREPSGRSHPARVPSAAGSFPPIVIFSWSRVSLACCRGSHSNNKAATAPSIAFYCPSIAHCANFDSIVGQEYCLPNPSSFKMEENGPVCVVFSCREMRSIIQLLEYSKTSPSPS